MRKKGYTLAELLIAMGIIAVISAIMLPMTNKFKPDSIKATYLKTYDSVTEAVADMMTLNGVYSIDDEYPLNNDKAFTSYDGSIKIKDGNRKFCEVLANSLHVNNLGYSCKQDIAEIFWKTYASQNMFRSDDAAFTTTNGVRFWVYTGYNASDPTKYRSDIYIDVNGDKSPNCIYDASSCKKPDIFRISVSSRGLVIPADPVGEYFLKTRTSLKSVKKYDIPKSAVMEYDYGSLYGTKKRMQEI